MDEQDKNNLMRGIEFLSRDIEKLKKAVAERAPGLAQDVLDRIVKEVSDAQAQTTQIADDARKVISAVRDEFAEYRKTIEAEIGKFREAIRGLGQQNATLKAKLREVAAEKEPK